MGTFERRALGQRRSSNWNYGGPKWRLSRSKIDLFTECKRCFYLDNKLGISRPRGPSFTLNIAVDALLKKEFDTHRASKTSHPLMKAYGLDAVPFSHSALATWQENFKGIECFHEPTGLTISGAVDDVWVTPEGELLIVDYKATSKDGDIDSLSDTTWENQYKRQMEIYQWLFRQNGFTVSDTGYFVYVNAKKDKEAFDGRLDFDVTLIPHTGKADWIDGVLMQIKKCLDDDRIPLKDHMCEHCAYVEMVRTADYEKRVAQAPVVIKKTKTKKVSKKESKVKIQRTPSLF